MKEKKSFIIVGLAVAAISVILFQAQTSAGNVNIDAMKASQMLAEGKFALVLDVRTKSEYTGAMGHLKGSKLMPIQTLVSDLRSIESFKDKPVLVYCHSGGRSAKSASILKSNGFTNVLNLDGGIMSWKANGFPTERKASLN